MQERDVYRDLAEIFRDVFGIDHLMLTPELSASDVPGWDSFKQIEIIIAVQERYKIKFHTRDLDGMRNVGDLARIALARTELAKSA